MMLSTFTFPFGFVLNQVSHLYATALHYGSPAPWPTSLQLYSSTALRLYASTPLRLYASTALRLYGSTLIPTPGNELQDI